MALRLILGDFLSVAALGAVTAVLCAWVVIPSWGMFAAMIVGMALGMVLGFAWSPLVGIWLGAHEAMIPAMLTGMAAGMVVSMRVVGGPLALADTLILGASIGGICLVYTYAMNALLRRETRFDGGAG